MKMRRKIFLALLVTTMLSVLAQENSKVFMGKVVNLTDKAIILETKDNRQQEIALASGTKYEHNGSASSRDSVKVGDIVVIRAGHQGGLLIANSVHSRSELRLDLRNPKYPAHSKKDDGKQGASSGDSPK